MNYQEALAYINSFSNYERGDGFTPDRDEHRLRVAVLLAELDDPHLQYTNTLIAGTKGKGSTAVCIERVLREAGVRTGLYTQPDLHSFRERCRVNGQPISEDEVVVLVGEVRAAVERIRRGGDHKPFIAYEISTALVLLHFQRQHVQHAVIEVGLGGRQDATNVTHPLVSVLTSISYDHMDVLGQTLTAIATEKAGIIKPGGLIATSAQASEALVVIAETARRQGARLVRIGPAEGDPAHIAVEAGQLPPVSYRYQVLEQHTDGQRFTVWTPERVYENIALPLPGNHQAENATLAVAVLELLRTQGYDWDESALRTGLQAVHWPARFQVVAQEPTIVIDGAHNTDSIEKVLQTVETVFHAHRLIIVLGINRDKDLVGIIQLLTHVDSIILTRVNNSRSASIEELEDLCAVYMPGVTVHRAETVAEALDLAQDLADSSDLICATGSLYLAAEALRWAGIENAYQS